MINVYSDKAIHTNFVLHEGLELIQKPYLPKNLLKNTHEILDQSLRTTDSNRFAQVKNVLNITGPEAGGRFNS